MGEATNPTLNAPGGRAFRLECDVQWNFPLTPQSIAHIACPASYRGTSAGHPPIDRALRTRCSCYRYAPVRLRDRQRRRRTDQGPDRGDITCRSRASAWSRRPDARRGDRDPSHRAARTSAARLRTVDLVIAFRELATLLSSGVSLGDAVISQSKGSYHPELVAAFNEISRELMRRFQLPRRPSGQQAVVAGPSLPPGRGPAS